ncbi:MAG: hypothetical protein JXB30_12395 [Anaerolineae bacterium]|nr:hypothetical protein [Anaerolineae bacterium]
MSKKRYWLLLPALILVVAFTACIQGAGPSAATKEVIIGTTDQLDSLDPADAYATHDWEIIRNTNPGLIVYQPGTADMVPGVAEGDPEISDDGLTYTFTISDGWKYPDGSELVAGDFVRGINRSLTMEGDVSFLVSTYVESVEAPDDKTVVFHLKAKRGDFIQIVSATPYGPLQEGQFPDDELVKFPETLSGVGPWQLTSYKENEQAVLERNPNYKMGFSESAPDRVIIRYFSDPTQMALAVEKGDIDIAWRILGPIETARLSTVEGLTADNTGGGGIRFLSINHDMEPFTDKNVRKALAYLVDRDEIVDRVMQGAVEPLYSIDPPGFLGSNEAFRDMYGGSPDVAKAEELLAASGYSADSPVEFDLWYPPEHYGAQAAQIFEVLKEQFEKSSMVKVTLQTQEWSTYIKALTNGEYPIGYLGWFFDYPDSSNYLDPFAQTDFAAGMGIFYSNPDMDQYLADAAASTDPAERADLYVEAQNLFAEDAVCIPLVFEAEYAVYRSDSVGKIVIGPALVFQYELIELK